jgi:pyruvate/2-oxoglutarate dehydrogenase complex dihydrolipoamide dehydrogenase (E3) component
MARDLDDSRPAAAMEATGARLFRGEGRLTDLRTVTVGREQVIARRAVVIANGSTAVIARRLPGMDATADQTAVPRVTYTDPEIASVGLLEAAAGARGIDIVVAHADPAETARGYIHDFHGGAVKLVADRERGVLIGATLVTPRAGEIVGELVLAINLRTPLKALADVIHPLPAFNRVLGANARGARREGGAARRGANLMSLTTIYGGHNEQYTDNP